jgi:hypothetical protein
MTRNKNLDWRDVRPTPIVESISFVAYDQPENE